MITLPFGLCCSQKCEQAVLSRYRRVCGVRSGVGVGVGVGACHLSVTAGNQLGLSEENINPHLRLLKEPSHTTLAARAKQMARELKAGKKFPFASVIRADVSDIRSMGLGYITFIRQVLACVSYPPIMKTIDFPSDVKRRANVILDSCSARSIGAYSASNGLDLVRRDVTAYITARDGQPANMADVLLTNGAVSAIKYLLTLFANHEQTLGKPAGVMVPIPNKSLYTTTCHEYGLQPVEYSLSEKNSWSINSGELERAYSSANSKICNVKVLVVVNPGNPTGHVLSKKNIEDIIRFAQKKKLFIIADEIFQENVFTGSTFLSFKKIAREMGQPYSGMELASVSSVEAGWVGEGGLRGGWVELVNMDPDVIAQLHKLISASLGSNTLGQVVIECVVNPPKAGDESYEKWKRERTKVIRSLEERAKILTDGLNAIKGYKCNRIQGSMYAYPRVEMRDKGASQPRDKATQYATALLQNTGVCAVPGDEGGSVHLRLSLLPPDTLVQMLDRLRHFHRDFTPR